MAGEFLQGGIFMKKVLCAILLVAVFAGTACAEKIGVLSRLDVPAEIFQPGVTVETLKKYVRTAIHTSNTAPSFESYDSMVALFMALNSGEIDSMSLPECVAEYVLRVNPNTEARAFMIMNGWENLVMGLKEGNEPLRDKISAAINDMAKDGTTTLLIRYHVQGPEAREPMPVEFEKYDGAETLKVAVTGDFPPIDFVDEGGAAAGYNTAMLAELGRRLHVNIKLLYTNAASRAAALMSGKADVVFWFKMLTGKDEQFDIPEGIITTAPYYGWNKMLDIGLAK